MVTFDLTAALLSGIGAWWIWTRLLEREFLWWYPAVLIVLGLFWTVSLLMSQALNGRLRKSLLEDLPSLFSHVLLSSMVVALGITLTEFNPDNAGLVLVAAGLGMVTVPVERGFVYALLNRHAGYTKRRVLIIGTSKVGVQVADLVSKDPQLRAKVVGFLDKEPLSHSREGKKVEGWPLLGSSYDLGRILEECMVDEVIIAFSTAPHQRILEMIWECDRQGVNVSVVPRFFEAATVQSTVENVRGIPLMHLNRMQFRSYNAAIKRCFDIVVAGVGLLGIWPLLLVIALAVRLDSPGPIIFSQQRAGCDGKAFMMYKFRSMKVGAQDISNYTVPGDLRRTRVGKFLRKLSLDELPQLINVLKGDMSLVGPRPEVWDRSQELAHIVYRYPHRYRVKSGVTGWAQVNGLRGELTSIEERVIFDNYYIENWSLWLDIRIIILTFRALLSRPELSPAPSVVRSDTESACRNRSPRG